MEGKIAVIRALRSTMLPAEWTRALRQAEVVPFKSAKSPWLDPLSSQVPNAGSQDPNAILNILNNLTLEAMSSLKRGDRARTLLNTLEATGSPDPMFMVGGVSPTEFLDSSEAEQATTLILADGIASGAIAPDCTMAELHDYVTSHPDFPNVLEARELDDSEFDDMSDVSEGAPSLLKLSKLGRSITDKLKSMPTAPVTQSSPADVGTPLAGATLMAAPTGLEASGATETQLPANAQETVQGAMEAESRAAIQAATAGLSAVVGKEDLEVLALNHARMSSALEVLNAHQEVASLLKDFPLKTTSIAAFTDSLTALLASGQLPKARLLWQSLLSKLNTGSPIDYEPIGAPSFLEGAPQFISRDGTIMVGVPKLIVYSDATPGEGSFDWNDVTEMIEGLAGGAKDKISSFAGTVGGGISDWWGDRSNPEKAGVIALASLIPLFMIGRKLLPMAALARFTRGAKGTGPQYEAYLKDNDMKFDPVTGAVTAEMPSDLFRRFSKTEISFPSELKEATAWANWGQPDEGEGAPAISPYSAHIVLPGSTPVGEGFVGAIMAAAPILRRAVGPLAKKVWNKVSSSAMGQKIGNRVKDFIFKKGGVSGLFKKRGAQSGQAVTAPTLLMTNATPIPASRSTMNPIAPVLSPFNDRMSRDQYRSWQIQSAREKAASLATGNPLAVVLGIGRGFQAARAAYTAWRATRAGVMIARATNIASIASLAPSAKGLFSSAKLASKASQALSYAAKGLGRVLLAMISNPGKTLKYGLLITALSYFYARGARKESLKKRMISDILTQDGFVEDTPLWNKNAAILRTHLDPIMEKIGAQYDELTPEAQAAYTMGWERDDQVSMSVPRDQYDAEEFMDTASQALLPNLAILWKIGVQEWNSLRTVSSKIKISEGREIFDYPSRGMNSSPVARWFSVVRENDPALFATIQESMGHVEARDEELVEENEGSFIVDEDGKVRERTPADYTEPNSTVVVVEDKKEPGQAVKKEGKDNATSTIDGQSETKGGAGAIGTLGYVGATLLGAILGAQLAGGKGHYKESPSLKDSRIVSLMTNGSPITFDGYYDVDHGTVYQ